MSYCILLLRSNSDLGVAWPAEKSLAKGQLAYLGGIANEQS